MVQNEHKSRRAEERAHRAGAGRLVRACAWLALVLLVPVALLVAVGPSVAWRLMPVHPARAAIAPDALAPREVIAQLDALDPTTDGGLAEAARIFSSAIVDHWPARDEVDPAVATTLFEHPPRWAVIQIGHALPDLLSALVLSHADLMRIERRDWRSAVMLGVGTDGQRALALARFLREKGVDAWPVVAAGRAVCVLGTPEAARALEPASGAIIEIAARTDYGEPTTLLSRRARVWWTLALALLAGLAWPIAVGSLDGTRSLRSAAVRRRSALGSLAKPLSHAFLACALISALAASLCGGVVLVVAYGPAYADRSLDTHPLRATAEDCKRGRVRDLDCVDAEDAIRRLEAIDPTTEEGLVEATRLFAAATLHHWPARGDAAPATSMRFYEDLPRWWDMRRARNSGDLDDWRRLAWLERGRWRSAIRMGVGLCSQHAIAISDYLREKGVRARPFGLDGHVIALVETKGGEWIVDPDFALVMRRPILEAGQDYEGVRQAYLEVGAPPSMASITAATFGPDGNTEYSIDFVGSRTMRHDLWCRNGLFGLAGLGLASALSWRLARFLRAPRTGSA
jgi:hypothetical protein